MVGPTGSSKKVYKNSLNQRNTYYIGLSLLKCSVNIKNFLDIVISKSLALQANLVKFRLLAGGANLGGNWFEYGLKLFKKKFTQTVYRCPLNYNDALVRWFFWCAPLNWIFYSVTIRFINIDKTQAHALLVTSATQVRPLKIDRLALKMWANCVFLWNVGFI